MLRVFRRLPSCASLLRVPTVRFSERLRELKSRGKEKLINRMQSTDSPRYWVTSSRPANFGDPLLVPTKPDNWFDKNRIWNEEDSDYKTRRAKLDVMGLLKKGFYLTIAIVLARAGFERYLCKNKYRVVDTYAEYDISGLKPGSVVATRYLGQPIFVRMLTRAEVAEMLALSKSTQHDTKSYVSTTPAGDCQLLVVSAKTDQGTIPRPYKGAYSGWYCPVTGQVFDKFGRIRTDGKKGKNLQHLNNTLHGNILCLEQKMDYYSNYSLYII